MIKFIKCFLGFHQYNKYPEIGIYGNTKISWECTHCKKHVPFWTPNGWKLNNKKYPK